MTEWQDQGVRTAIVYFGTSVNTQQRAQPVRPLPLGCMALAAGNVNWRLWNKLGPRQWLCLRSSSHALFLETRCRAIAGRTARCRCKFQYNGIVRFSATARLSCWSLSADCSELSVKKWQVLERTSQITLLTQTSNHVITLNYCRHHYSPPT